MNHYNINYTNYQAIFDDNASFDDSVEKVKEYCVIDKIRIFLIIK
jgi:hypothetical protein